MSLLSQIPKPSFIFDPSQANESRDALTQVRRLVDQSGGGFSRPPADPNFPLVPNKYVQNKAGILEGIIPNVPAVEFDGAFNKGYLAEPSATNLATWSEDLSNGVWSKLRINVEASSELFRSGVNYQKLVANTDNNTHFISRNFSGAGTRTESVFAKQGEYRYIRLRWFNATDGERGDTVFDLQEGVVVSGGGKIRPYKDGYRCSVAATSTVDDGLRIDLLNNSQQLSFAGNGTDGIFVSGVQVETGSVATSYIPTVASTATRPADSLVFTDAQDLIGQSSGVILVKADLRINKPTLATKIQLDDLSSNNDIRIFMRSVTDSPPNQISFQLRTVDGTLRTVLNYTPPSDGVYNFLFAYSADKRSFFVNSIKESEQLTNIPWFGNDLSRLGVANNPTGIVQWNDFIKSAYLWNNADWITDELAKTLTRL
jgi:hypothetical protein